MMMQKTLLNLYYGLLEVKIREQNAWEYTMHVLLDKCDTMTLISDKWYRSAEPSMLLKEKNVFTAEFEHDLIFPWLKNAKIYSTSFSSVS